MAEHAELFPGAAYMVKEPISRHKRVIVAEELDLIFSQKDLHSITKLINSGEQVESIAEIMNREIEEVLHAFVHMMFDKRFKIKKKLVLFND